MIALRSRALVGMCSWLLALAVCGAAAQPAPQLRPDITPSAQLAFTPAPECGPAKMRAVRARATRPSQPTEGADFEFIDCSLTFDPRDPRPVTKRLVFEGARASNVVVNCNGVTIDGGPGTPNYNPAEPWSMVEINSKRLDDTGLHWERPSNITFRNGCKIKGSVALLGITGVESTTPGFAALARNNAPSNVTFDGVTITGVPCSEAMTGGAQCVPLYLFTGVNRFQLLNSHINGTSGGPNIYLDDLAFRNTIRNNRIEASNQKGGKRREVLAIDSASENLIVNNFFSSLEDGGIYLYRNCGEDNSARIGRPTDNVIINNVFFYDRYDGDNPSIFVAERNGRDIGKTRCPDHFFDQARNNAVMQNQIFKLPVADEIVRHPLTGAVVRVRRGMIRVGAPDVNTPNFIEHNETVTKEITRAAGCFLGNGYPNFLLDGQFTNAFHHGNGDPMCTGFRSTCRDGALIQTSDSTCQARPVRQMDVDCTRTGTNSGCQKTVAVPPGTRIVGAKAACNLEFGTITSAELDTVPANVMTVRRASDDVSQGQCTVGGTTIRRSMAGITGVNGLSSVSVSCRERDANGGDCSIRVRLYFR